MNLRETIPIWWLSIFHMNHLWSAKQSISLIKIKQMLIINLLLIAIGVKLEASDKILTMELYRNINSPTLIVCRFLGCFRWYWYSLGLTILNVLHFFRNQTMVITHAPSIQNTSTASIGRTSMFGTSVTEAETKSFFLTITCILKNWTFVRTSKYSQHVYNEN